MSDEIPAWLREDGTDQRLVNPAAAIGCLVGTGLPPGSIPHGLHSASLLNAFPGFAEQFTAIHTQVTELDIFGRIRAGNPPSEEEANQADTLWRQQLFSLAAVAEQGFGSVETFMNWWETMPPDQIPFSNG